MSHLRFKEVEVAFNRAPVKVDIPQDPPSRYYGCMVFNRTKMFEYLPRETYEDLTRAIAYHDTVSPLLDTIRYHVDKLELMVDDELWPLPKYRELLFIR